MIFFLSGSTRSEVCAYSPVLSQNDLRLRSFSKMIQNKFLFYSSLISAKEKYPSASFFAKYYFPPLRIFTFFTLTKAFNPCYHEVLWLIFRFISQFKIWTNYWDNNENIFRHSVKRYFVLYLERNQKYFFRNLLRFRRVVKRGQKGLKTSFKYQRNALFFHCCSLFSHTQLKSVTLKRLPLIP